MDDKIAVIGGGPAGMIAAGTAGLRNKNVSLFDKNNKLGKKLFITGKGRCNITNDSDIETLLQNVIVNNKFLYSAFYTFSNYDIINLLKKYGVKTKVERGNRVFPESDKSSDVINALKKYLIDNNVKIMLNKDIKNIKLNKSGKFNIFFNNDSFETFDKIILATGGMSYKQTGSSGDGYKYAKTLGHSIVKPKPALVPCEVKEAWVKDLQGLSLKNVSISAYNKSSKIFEDFGEMLFTHFGISGPIALTMSNYINKYVHDKIEIYIDLKPSLSEDKLEKRIIRDFEKYSRKQFKNSLNDLLPSKLIPVIIKLSSIDGDKFVHQITKNERRKLIEILKSLKLTFEKFRPLNEAIITSGGISTNEINPSTMESKIVKGLFFAGEIIDVDALTGGFNLQIAYSTGYLAGLNC